MSESFTLSMYTPDYEIKNSKTFLGAEFIILDQFQHGDHDDLYFVSGYFPVN